ncbi:hypothetical protein [Hymenobacter metallilatus]|uniref:Uncharacterized protein n=1 Tax=Hymenobacter metallilatus TaxID=2493666 RepID=A0A428IZF1_9BACT|nr:hypothetical protein [Hymenobacter metallilatus]RSK24734.1 hypothetical protein EI290_18935 [Hymenobacter metallilatus]
MQWVPSLEEVFVTDFTPDEVLHVIRANTTGTHSWGHQDAAFRGVIEGSPFTLYRLSLLTNWATRPQITGWIEPNPQGPGAKLILQQQASMGAFWSGLILSSVLAACMAALLWAPMLEANGHPGYLLVPFILPLFVLVFTLVPFRLAVAENRHILTRLLFLQQVAKG